MKKGCLLLVLGFFAILVISTIFAINNADEIGATPNGKIAKSLDTTPENGETIINVFKEIGIDENVNIKHDELLDNAHFEGEKGYRLNTKDASNIILYMNADGTISSMVYADNELYKENTVKAKLNDFIITDLEKAQLRTSTMKYIDDILKAPSTAKYTGLSDWKFAKQNGETIIQGAVDSQNGFGAMLKSEFQLIIKDGNVSSLIFDGQEYMK